MAYRFKLADLETMTDPELETILAEIKSGLAAPRNGQAAVLNARIRVSRGLDNRQRQRSALSYLSSVQYEQQSTG